MYFYYKKKVLSIFSMLCCLIPGIISFRMNRESKRAINEGNIELAKENASTAKKYAIAGIVLGSIITVIVLTIKIIQLVLISQQN